VSIPSLWVTTYAGSGTYTITAYGDTAGTAGALLGMDTFYPPAHPSGGSYVWMQYTNLNSSAYNNLIRRVELSAPGNAQMDDMTLIMNTNAGTLQSITASVLSTNLFLGGYRQVKVDANYEFASAVDVTSGAGVIYQSSATNVVTVTTNGLMQAVGAGSATVMASLEGQTSSVSVAVSPAVTRLVDFNAGPGNIGNYVTIPADYQPVPGLTLGYINVGLFNGGPDHTTGITGSNHYNTYQFQYDAPQVITFSQPVSLPSLWLTSFLGTGEAILVSAYGDEGGNNLLGTVAFPTPIHANGGSYVWAECTNFDAAAYNGLIRRIELSAGSPNANLDDMLVVRSVTPAKVDAVVSSGGMMITWSTNAADAMLMESPVLGNGAVWTPVPGSPSLVGGNYQVMLPLSGTNRFFRLQY